MLHEMRLPDIARGSWPAPENETQRAFVLASSKRSKKVLAMKQSPVALRNDWFTKLTGFSERSPNEVRENLTIQDSCLSSKISDQSFQCGCLEIVSLRELRERVAKVELPMVPYEDSVVLWGEDSNGSKVDLARWRSSGRGFCR